MSRVFRRVLLSVVVCSSLLGLSSQVAAQRCGVERWSIKTGTDSAAADVDLANPQNSSIAELVAIDPPRPIPPYRVAPTEDTVFVVNATLTAYRWEGGSTGDSDYHLVLEDDQGNTMVAEIPDPNCVGDESPFASLIASARAEFDDVLTATTTFSTANIPVQITGVGFFDFFHGQRGAAPNVIELHPVLDIAFNPDGQAPIQRFHLCWFHSPSHWLGYHACATLFQYPTRPYCPMGFIELRRLLRAAIHYGTSLALPPDARFAGGEECTVA